ncbi:hypothetical protein PSU4_10220 [Pseudonocardia sulfidoxydans NBRC 16205]|uniref:Uncharacterized protein n=1 Tax=Pseudonocardia sulfidoxydans NBRC 16205 TaxID=1223511 RepID=A0A511DGE0_9PSEU|nr:hypothetical protein [Pseudonocardia sulfidoxydans]GEL22068.1 hypothetical protein PSU4_10220 [Pseudonocardia sulfidoxydans NBRC 16205]
MDVAFTKLPRGRRTHSVVRRADGVRWSVDGGVAGPGLPHDLVHLVVERAIGEQRGFWGSVAAGVVFGSMTHLEGRRPPHGGEKSTVLLRERRGGLQAAELLADLVEHVAAQKMTSTEQVRAAARTHLRPEQRAQVDPARILEAAEALRDMESRWARLAEGEELTVQWPDPARRRRGRRRHI